MGYSPEQADIQEERALLGRGALTDHAWSVIEPLAPGNQPRAAK
jgi:hypothetical protein